MTTDWNLLDVTQGYRDYDLIREQVLAHPLMFSALGLDRLGCREVLDYG